MKKPGLILFTWLMLGAGLPAMAQQAENEQQGDETQSADSSEQADADAGLTVTEIRYKNRLDEVIIEHGESGVREYYDIDDSRTFHQEGSISERGNLRKWRFGGDN